MFSILYERLRDWVECVLDAYRPELRALVFPFFVHCYLELVEGGKLKQAASFLRDCGKEHAYFHRDELSLLGQVTVPSQLASHEFAARVRTRRFELPSSPRFGEERVSATAGVESRSSNRSANNFRRAICQSSLKEELINEACNFLGNSIL